MFKNQNSSRKIKFLVAGGIVTFLLVTVAVVFSWRQAVKSNAQFKEDPLLKYCRLHGKMDSKSFDEFISHMSNERQLAVLRAIDNESIAKYEKIDSISRYKTIKKQLVWQSSHWISYPFKDKENVNYDEIVRWVAKKYNILGIETKSTIRIERQILSKMFADIWDRMTTEQRKAALEKMQNNSKIDNIAGISLLSGSAALATLSTTVAFSGFAFYTGMSSLLYSAASVLGVTLPFATYVGASSTVAVLTGPIGWALIAVGAAVGAGFIGMPDYQKTAQMIVAIHLIKVDAIQKSGLKIQDYIGSDIKPVDQNKQ